MADKDIWDKVLKLYEIGGSDVEVAVVLGLTKKAMLELYIKNADFAKIIDKGRTAAEAWAMRTLRENIGIKEFNPSMFTFMLKNRYGWADRVETKDTSDKDKDLSLDELRSEYANLVKKLEKNDPSLVRTLAVVK